MPRRIMLTGIPSYRSRFITGAEGTKVSYGGQAGFISSKGQLLHEIRRVANTGNYLIGEGAYNSVASHSPTYIPFWHLVKNSDQESLFNEINREFDVCVIATANMLRPGYSADLEAAIFEKLRIPIVVMGIGIQRIDRLAEDLPAGTKKFLEVLKAKEHFFLTRGAASAAFLRDFGMSFVEPTGCPSMYLSPTKVRESLTRLTQLKLLEVKKIAFGGYLGSVADSMVDAQALLPAGMTANYVIQDEPIVYNLEINCGDDEVAYDHATGEITAPVGYKLQEKWTRPNRLFAFFNTEQWRVWASMHDLCFGRRFHGCVIGMQSGTPSLMVAVDDRMREMLQYLELPYIEASVWNREFQKKAFLEAFVADLEIDKILEIYSSKEANFRSILQRIGIGYATRS